MVIHGPHFPLLRVIRGWQHEVYTWFGPACKPHDSFRFGVVVQQRAKPAERVRVGFLCIFSVIFVAIQCHFLWLLCYLSHSGNRYRTTIHSRLSIVHRQSAFSTTPKIRSTFKKCNCIPSRETDGIPRSLGNITLTPGEI